MHHFSIIANMKERKPPACLESVMATSQSGQDKTYSAL